MNFSADVQNYLDNDLRLSVADIEAMDLKELQALKETLKMKHEYEDLLNLSTKLLGNSMYGASGNQYFYFFNPKLSASITAEGRGTIHYMEQYLTKFFCEVFPFDKELPKQFGIEFKDEATIKASKFYQERQVLVYGDTDSLYINYGGLFELMTDETRPKTDDDKLKWIVDFNRNFLDAHNKEVLRKWIDEERHGHSIHNFELETVSTSTIHLKKKKYMCAIKWKDGKTFPKPKIKAKGIEIIKSDTPQFCRKYLQEMCEMLLLKNIDELHKTFNIEIGNIKQQFMQAPIESISCSGKVGEYYKYIISTDGQAPEFAPKTPAGLQAAGMFNWAIQRMGATGDFKPIQPGDKIKYYVTGGRQSKSGKISNRCYFGYPQGNLPPWVDQIVPINRKAQFEKTFLNPINRIAEAVGLPTVTGEGAINLNLF